jgi:hypothetical protein
MNPANKLRSFIPILQTIDLSLYKKTDNVPVGICRKNLVHQDKKFEIYHRHWGPMSSLDYHAHPNECILTVLGGKLLEHRTPRKYSDVLYEYDCSYMNMERGLHSIYNKNTYPAQSLHIYEVPSQNTK